MKLSGFWVLFFLLQMSLLLLFFPSYINASPSSDMALNHRHLEPNESFSAIPLNRKLKFQNDEYDSPRRNKVHQGDLNLDDYHPIDPVPSSKTSVKPGPIEHGTPLLPHIPNPPPPDQPQPGDFV
ncbi:uncharacterized protein LOC111021399 isoform X2 [Momordica charantia]|uniref:Uncharacterized protein LOC111021399 isoform X2 n=1 Tax=Momordica charantia TaxID=3673 RepID=A0A6J1DND6_MOMCH|nr:uncharacterized protein LOC111021399 isoform X2 [Momordica charantia]